MRKYILTAAILAAFSLTSCKETKEQESKTETTISSSSTKIIGTYKTSLPGANSMMDQELILNADNSFVKNTTYVDKGNKKFTEEGHYKIENDIIILDLDSKTNITKYKIGDGFIQQLDMEGKEITGAQAENYKFKKQ